MTTLREAAQMALDALMQSETDPHAQVELSALEDATIEALRAALAQPEYEEGCTPTDVRVLREANARMAQELYELREKNT